MPCLRGIELSIIIQPDSLPLPEFPHPDASSVRVVSRGETTQTEENKSSPHGSDSARIQKLAPRASVYIPSTSGSQFWVQYRIHRSPEPSCYLFLKLSMNGRHITSCGITDAASGTISRALYEPSDRWHLKQNELLLKRSGIESRSFCFSPGPDAVAAADDGGVIEVQVFRAKSRRRCTPQLVPHRDQQQYGVISPSTGLLEHPEDAAYYEWILHDAVEAPFATFCFHYRAWTYLWGLNLATDDSNSPLHNSRLRERLGRNLPKSSDRETSPSKDEEVSGEELDIGDYGEEANDARVIEAETAHTRSDWQNHAPQYEEFKFPKPSNRLPSHSRKPSLHSAASFREIPCSGDPFITCLLPPVMEEEEPFTSPYSPPRHEMPTASPTHSYHRENARSRVRRPLPTVNEVPTLE
ncbi:uncharacterized protein TrAtP1_010991 [Trichoderma atroviride]|uniref:Uncharacterized protein n=1 Tax=Hypocrea atroviridis (strain ATCC 20476 / IMI 206040) TaxID=452589 RepID=G9NIY3_HYPAI|nr:uncharacterized protein TRIATDRAFT_92756 [Trichoderma atroviride IMI 206040]EHK49739.1 hypothetical protein TRIATDRAFT_92756 [Trichoderma atroviride IMI 206040]UKZ69988.1 hypothetical protein TrAtP1_010991 [Trichoderma atroviride]